MLVLSPFPSSQRRPTVELAAQRNDFVANLAVQVFIAHAAPGSKTEDFARELAAAGKPLLTLDSRANDLPPKNWSGVMLVLGLKERGVKMARRKHTAEQIINKLREAEVAISAGSTVAEVSRQIGVTQQTFYRWRTEYGGLKIDQARRLKQLETENGRLRRAVADLTLDNQILREAAEGNF